MAHLTEPPTLSLATRKLRLLGSGTLLEATRLAGIRLLDLELGGRAQALKPLSLVRGGGARGPNVRAIWLPPERGRLPGSAGSEARAELAGTVVAATGAGAVILDRPHGEGRSARQRARLLQAVRAQVPSSARLTFALRPESLAGGREHLSDLSALRLLAEEWDFDLALDLDGPIDPTWESEAAVSKLLPRLTVVRLGAIDARPPGRGRERQTARVLAFLADLGYSGAIALSASAPLWRPDRAATLALAYQDARARVMARFDAIPKQPRIDTPLRRGPGIELPG